MMHNTKKGKLPLPDGFVDGASFQDYLIGDRIGSGGFGAVFHATKNQDQHYALKVIALRNNDPAEQRRQQMIKNEIEIMKKINHPNILKLEDSFIHKEIDYTFTFLVSPLCDCDLGKYLKRNGPLSEFKLVYFMRQLIAAFMQLDMKKIIHRDIKLENIFWVQETDSVVIGDFGLAKHGAEWAKTICGSPSYKAPEIQTLQNQMPSSDFTPNKPPNSKELESYDDKVDVYCLAIVLYELVTGRRQKESVSEFNQSEGKVKARLEVGKPFKFQNGDLSNRHLKDLIEGMLEINSISRLSWYQISQHPLFNEQLPDLTLGANPIEDGDQLLETFVNQDSFICHVDDLKNYKEFSKQRVAYKFDLKNQAFSIFENPPGLRDLLNQAVEKYFEMGKRFFNRKVFARQKTLSLSAGWEKIRDDCETAYVNALGYFCSVFPQLNSICENILDIYSSNHEESISFNGLNTKTKEIFEKLKNDFDPKLIQPVQQETNILKLKNEAFAKTFEVYNGISTQIETKDPPPPNFRHIMEEIAANLYFLVSFTEHYLTNTAIHAPEWKHLLEEFLYNSDARIVNAFSSRLAKKTQSELTAF